METGDKIKKFLELISKYNISNEWAIYNYISELFGEITPEEHCLLAVEKEEFHNYLLVITTRLPEKYLDDSDSLKRGRLLARLIGWARQEYFASYSSFVEIFDKEPETILLLKKNKRKIPEYESNIYRNLLLLQLQKPQIADYFLSRLTKAKIKNGWDSITEYANYCYSEKNEILQYLVKKSESFEYKDQNIIDHINSTNSIKLREEYGP